MSREQDGTVTLSKGALAVVISTCLAVGSGGAFVVAKGEARSPEQHATKIEALAVADANFAVADAQLQGRVFAVEQRFDKMERSLERIEGKVDRVLNK